ncbi:MAG TPA: arginyl aminopeptidase, partial [Ohtaekwangia sp.]|nr:arginyl aminopeptidase [Ohtaekwangia sp.]
MNKFHALTFAGILSACCAFAQDPVARQYGDLITTQDLKDNLSILASDALEGRETGKRGQKMAAAFIKAHFEELGLTGPVDGKYFQPVELYTSLPGDIYVRSGQSKFLNFQDVAYYGSATTDGEVSVPAVFVGRGRKEDFDQVDVAGKAAIVLLSREDNFRAPLDIARERKAKMTMIFNSSEEDFKQLVGQFKSFLSG